MKQIQVFTLFLVLAVLLPCAVADVAVTTEELCNYLITTIPDLTLADCQSYGFDVLCNAMSDPNYYYDSTTNTCFKVETAVDNGTIVTTTAVADSVQQQITAIQTQAAAVDAKLTALDGRISRIETDLSTQQGQLNNINYQLTQIESQLSVKVDSLATGQAFLQEDLNKTQGELGTVETELEKRKAFDGWVSIFIFLLVAAGMTIGIIYYLNRQGGKKELSSQTFNYITTQIRLGKKFPQIKDELMRAGWAAEDAEWAFKETSKKNYLKYKNKSALGENREENREEIKTEKVSASARTNRTQTQAAATPTSDRAKIITIVVVTLILIFLGVFFFSGSVGQAIHIQQTVKEDTKELVTKVECTPPHIINPDGDGCCQDQDNNGKCDDIEKKELETIKAEGACQDNFQCPQGKLCINKECRSLNEIYQGSPVCDKMCQTYAVKIVTTDSMKDESYYSPQDKATICKGELSREETYNTKVGQGSYTAAGAIEWKVVSTPPHCNGEKAIIPIKIIKKRAGTIIGEEVITLEKGQNSATITHPDLVCKNLRDQQTVPRISFSIFLDDIYELCN